MLLDRFVIVIMSFLPLVAQYFMKNRAVSEKDLRDFIIVVNPQRSDLDILDVVDGIKSILQWFNLTVELTRCELTGSVYYVCISTVQREWFANYPLLSKDEEHCMFVIINEIVNNNGLPYSSNEAINLIISLEHSIMPERAVSILNSFVNRKILVENQNGHYLVGPLVLTSLKKYLSNMQNAKTCALCTKEVVYSEHCDSCGVDMHIYCYREAQQDPLSSVCPSCPS